MPLYDVFLSHATADKPAVEHLARKLREEGIEPFLDKWHLIPGEPWQEALEEALDQSRTCAVFLGKAWGSWQNEEMRSALETRVRDAGFRVIPVLLPGGMEPGKKELPRFLRRLTWVDFRAGLADEDAFRHLLAGIQGKPPDPGSTVDSVPVHVDAREISETGRLRRSELPNGAGLNLRDLATRLWPLLLKIVELIRGDGLSLEDSLREGHEALRGKVKRRIDRVLRKEVPEGRRLHIRWEELPDAVGRPDSERTFAEVAASELVEPIHEHFLGKGRSLLILGAPGSGKSIALLELARGLLKDPRVGVPVVFHLASWKRNDHSLADWMARELKQVYHAGSVAKALLGDRGAKGKKHNRILILPLLDGLDEVEAGCRHGCVDAINDYLEDHGLGTIMVVTCHKQVYERLPVLQLETAVDLRPLEPAQIEEYLDPADPALAGLRAALAGDAGLQKLATSPLMLTMLESTFRDASPEDLPSGDTDLEEQVFEAYVTDKLKPGSKLPRAREEARRFRRYPRARARRSLAWLAHGMANHNPALFQVERLQPDWLTSDRQVFAYAVLSRSLGGCLLGLPIALALVTVRPELADASLLAGAPPLAGALVGALETVRLRRSASPAGRRAAVLPRWLGRTLLLGGVAFLTVLLLGIPWVEAAPDSLHRNWRIGMLVKAGLSLGLGFGVVFGGRGANRGGDRDIRVAKTALAWRAWSWRGTAIGASSLLMLSLAFWALLPLGSDATVSYLRGADIWVPISLIAALLGGLLFGAFGGLRGRSEKKDRPNQGTWLALHNAGVAGLTTGLATMLGLGLVLGALAFAGGSIPRGTLPWLPLKTGLVVGLLAGLAYSGLDFVQHFSLRLVLRLAKLVPYRLVGFLDHAVKCGLLRQPGGSYQFYNPRLRKWFAKRYSAEPDRRDRKRDGAGNGAGDGIRTRDQQLGRL